MYITDFLTFALILWFLACQLAAKNKSPHYLVTALTQGLLDG